MLAGSEQRAPAPAPPPHADPTAYIPFVRRIAHRIARRLPASVEVDDLIGAGTIGLMEAFARYRPEGGRSFETYAEFRVKGAILDELRKSDPVNRSVRTLQQKIASKTAELTAQLGRPPETAEIAEALDITVEELTGPLGRLQCTHVVSAHAPGAQLVSDEKSQEERVARREMIDLAREEILGLPERQRLVLSLYYVEGLNQQQIGDILGVTESRVSQILSKTKRRLRERLQRRGV